MAVAEKMFTPRGMKRSFCRKSQRKWYRAKWYCKVQLGFQLQKIMYRRISFRKAQRRKS